MQISAQKLIDYILHFNKMKLWLLTRYPKIITNDEKYLKKWWYYYWGYPLNLNNPVTYNEKLQWLKLYDRNPRYTDLVDKVEVKNFVSTLIGNKYVIPTIAVYSKVEDIMWEKLPDQFVMKCTHDSGGNIICKDKSKLNIEEAKKKLSKCLKYDYYMLSREWPYKDVPRRILVEKYLEDSATSELRDYKFFCFDGEVKAMFVATERQQWGKEVKFDFFDAEYNHLAMRQGHQNAGIEPERPTRFEEMKRLAENLSKGIPQVRVDFYECDGEVYFGELTFFHFSGMVKFEPEEWDYTFGNWLTLPQKV